MTTQHTSTPYETFGPLSFQIYGGDPKRRIAVLDYCQGQSSEEHAATAAFIVRACNAHDELVAAHESVIEWTGDDHDMPNDASARLEWYARRLLMIRNCSRAALAKVSK